MLPTTPIEDYIRKKEKLIQQVRDKQAILTQLELETGLRISPFMGDEQLQLNLRVWNHCQQLQKIAQRTMEILETVDDAPFETKERVHIVIRKEE